MQMTAGGMGVREVAEKGPSDKMALWGHVTMVEKDMKEFSQT